ncbi:uncharacterized protein LOC116942450 isoform X2 [Petromyzon marinus]|uniref:uncharacterized protein LOC116942450 isoform X2 n=2 Tax=Petromyzon marinus TaxID=7757 RepID=UPI003F701A13
MRGRMTSRRVDVGTWAKVFTRRISREPPFTGSCFGLLFHGGQTFRKRCGKLPVKMNTHTCNASDLYSLNPRLALSLRNEPLSNYSSQGDSQLLFNSQNLVEAQASNMYCLPSQMESEPYKYHDKYKSFALFHGAEGKEIASIYQPQGQVPKQSSNYVEQLEYLKMISKENERREKMEHILSVISSMEQKINELRTELTRERENRELMYSVVSQINNLLQGLETKVAKHNEILEEVLNQQVMINGNIQNHQKNFHEFQSHLLGGQAHFKAHMSEMHEEIKSVAANQKNLAFQHGFSQTNRALSTEQLARCMPQVVCGYKVDPVTDETVKMELQEKVLPRAVKRLSSQEQPTRPLINNLCLEDNSDDDSDDEGFPLRLIQFKKKIPVGEIKCRSTKAHPSSRPKETQVKGVQHSYPNSVVKSHACSFSMANQIKYSKRNKVDVTQDKTTSREGTRVTSSPNCELSGSSNSREFNNNCSIYSDTNIVSAHSGIDLEQELWDLSPSTSPMSTACSYTS